MMKTVIVLTVLLTGCASYRPIVDTQNVDLNNYEADLIQCQQYAKGINPAESALGGALAGATFGAAIGAIAGAFTGDVGRGAAVMASLTGAQGAAQGAASGAETQKTIIRRCLAGRGYSVLN